MAAIDTVIRVSERTPKLGLAQWALRVPLAAILINQGISKVYGGMLANAEAYGFPVWQYVLATFTDFAAPAALILGGLSWHWTGDVLTRLGGLGIFASTVAVITVIYAGGGWQGWQFQGLIAAGGLFFLLRGNDAPNRI